MKLQLLFLLIVLVLDHPANCQTKEEYYKKASRYYDQADYVKAIENINKALSMDPTNSDYLLVKGNSLEKTKRYQEAFDAYTFAIQSNPKDAVAYNQRGLLLMKFQETENAIKDFSTALEFEKADTMKLSLLLNRGAAKINIRDFNGAYDDFITALKFDTLNIGTLNNLAAVCDETGRGDQTLGYLYKIIRIDSTFTGAYGNIGFKYQEMGDHKTAIKFFNKVIELDKNEPLAYSNRSYNYYKLGEYKLAMSDINLSLKLYPTNSYAYRTRALIYISLKNDQKACDDIAEALRLGYTKMYGEDVVQLKKEHCK